MAEVPTSGVATIISNDDLETILSITHIPKKRHATARRYMALVAEIAMMQGPRVQRRRSRQATACLKRVAALSEELHDAISKLLEKLEPEIAVSLNISAIKDASVDDDDADELDLFD